MNTLRPFHFHSPAAASCNSSAVRRAGLQLLGGPLRQGTEDTRAEAGPCVAVAGGVGGANRQTAGRPVGDDPRDGVAAAVVVAEDLAEEAPDGGDRVEQPVAILDAVRVEDVEDAELGQGVGEG